ncbi:MAG: hypothetical protein KC613_24185, partial [Myxococcales bacterium]|nr:hypothetical protein [Myxococcales bacterium]
MDGAGLRTLQREAVELHRRIKASAPDQAPHLFALASPHFLVLFPLNGDPFARRQRFTPEKLGQSSTLAALFGSLQAATMATWAVVDAAPAAGAGKAANLLARLRRQVQGDLRFDFDTHLYGGHRLDDEFVAFMGHQRARLVRGLLDEARAEQTFAPAARVLADLPADAPAPSLADLEGDPLLRKQVVAAVDTVLLRLVLYRYLQAQHRDVKETERGLIGVQDFDSLATRTLAVDGEKYRKRQEDAKAARSITQAEQLGFNFDTPAPVAVVDAQAFVEGMRQASAHYQQSAGGDLHRGRLAKAADLFFEQILTDPELRDEYATLIEGTRANRYSFNYEDLDPRAFQRFYEDTIGTDI